MMRYPPASAVYVTTAAFLLYSLSSCASSSRPATELEKYDDYEYADQATFNRPYGETYRAAVASLEKMGFTISLTDENTGELQAEAGTTALRPEETGIAVESDKEESGDGVLAAIVLVLLAIIMFFAGGESDDAMEVATHEPVSRTVYVYVVALELRALDTESTIITVGASRYDYEGDELVGSVRLENKYLNHSLFDRIEEHLTRSDRPAAQPGEG